MMPALILAFAFSVIIILLLRKPAFVAGLVALPGEHRKHDDPTPLVGGLAIFFSWLLCGLVFSVDLPSAYYWAFALLVLFGALDDRWEVPFWVRFIVQIGAGWLLVREGVVLLDLGHLVSAERFTLGRWSTALTLFSMVGVINAINMIDGLDGLLGGLLLVFLASMGTTIAIADGGDVLFQVVIMTGAIAGFLLFNFRFTREKMARVFMGDAGSMFLGLFAAWLLIDNSQGPNRAFSPVVALWMLAVPLFDTVGVMLRRIFRRRSPFAADRLHTHHLLLELGCSVRTAVLLLLVAAILLSATGIAGYSLGVPDRYLFFGFLGLFALYLILIETNQRKTE